VNAGLRRSPVNTVDVCVVSSDNCADFSNAHHVLFTLLDANLHGQGAVDPDDNLLPAGVVVRARAVSAGPNGLSALQWLLRNAAQCDLLIGPSRSDLAFAINPIVNTFQVPVIGFSSTAPELSDKMRYPFFSRVAPTDAAVARAVAGLCAAYQWDRVAVVTQSNTYGANIGSVYGEALHARSVTLEAKVLVNPDDNSNASMVRALTLVKNELITRIVVVAISADEAHLQQFFDVASALGMLTTHIFFLSDTLCQYTDAMRASTDAASNNANGGTAAYGGNSGAMPGATARGVRPLGSFCANPTYNEDQYAQLYARLAAAEGAEADKLLREGGFRIETCPGLHHDIYSPFAHDAALVALSVIRAAVTANGGTLGGEGGATAFSNRTATLQMIRATRLRGATGVVAFNQATGDRVDASFQFTVQQRNNQIVTVGTFNDEVGYQQAVLVSPIVWPDNTTTIPRASTRSATFVIVHTAEGNPTAVFVSILGTIVTVIATVFCYRHYKLNKEVKEAQEQKHDAPIDLGPRPSHRDLPAPGSIPKPQPPSVPKPQPPAPKPPAETAAPKK